MSSGLLNSEEVHAVCVDAVFALFICPAIVDPNALGVIDTPLITYMARSNLMQVAQILQVCNNVCKVCCRKLIAPAFNNTVSSIAGVGHVETRKAGSEAK